MTLHEKDLKKILSDAFTEYVQAARHNEEPGNFIFPRDKYRDVISYQTAKVLEYLKIPIGSPDLKKWFEKVEKHLAEYEYFSSSESYLFEACNLIQQLESNRTCEWSQCEGAEEVFSTGCGCMFEFIYDGPEENHFAYCPYCGGKLAVHDGHT